MESITRNTHVQWAKCISDVPALAQLCSLYRSADLNDNCANSHAFQNFVIRTCTVLSSYRLIHQASGRTYHDTFNPPKVQMKDDVSVDIVEE